ncbi:simple sugar transport system permease protein [Stella humosa]|uniref:Simple sugar transport system permease protein n=1 Tax=Stella humosa TaxID=94 RepID=A0A3N1KU99_9PROT|nr:ABC transporter permease [Stella humosa]ROP83564.1 simple sugar transport system permease protein [Stella humosa]BBK33164.1 sugar ABC transporter permease [Stella humosa]
MTGWRGLLSGAGDGTNRALLATIAAAMLAFGLVVGDGFFSFAAMRSMAFQMPELGILSLAMMVTLLSGGINLAVIATANLSALAMAWVLTGFVPGSEGPAWVAWQGAAIAAGFAVAAAAGLLNGVLIAYLRVSPILATLGTMTLLKGLAIGLTRGEVLSGFPEPILYLGNGTLLGVPAGLYLFAATAVLVAIILGRTPLGAAIVMIGSNEKAARFSGIDTRAVIVRVYLMSGLLAGLAALVMMARFNSANAAYGESYLLVTILAAVLGGTNPMGGAGRVGGLVLALVLLQVVSSGFNQLDVSPFLTLAIWGVILLAVTGLAARRAREGTV